jgi:hypothetical protein
MAKFKVPVWVTVTGRIYVTVEADSPDDAVSDIECMNDNDIDPDGGWAEALNHMDVEIEDVEWPKKPLGGGEVSDA